jgi:acyl-CoA reductase-like NAD-dependent aldehyde dehydrogenase
MRVMSSIKGLLMNLFPLLIGGNPTTTSTEHKIYTPYLDKPVGSTYLADADLIEQAIQKAVRGFEQTKTLPSHKRAAILNQVAQLIKRDESFLAQLIAREAGKPLKAARTEVQRAQFTFTAAAEEAKRINGESFPLDWMESTEGRWGVTRRMPIGPVTAISPFNFPLNLVAHKIAPAIAAGNSFIIKPASQTPLTALHLGSLILEAGYPKDAVNVIVVPSSKAHPLITDDRIAKLTFTGSPEVGWHLKSKAGRKKITLELGGNAATVIHHDCDISYAIPRLLMGGFGYSGQVCISVQRIFVHDSVWDSFVDAFIPAVKNLQIGDPEDEHVTIGPLINDSEADRVMAWIDEAVEQGARCILGGQRDGRIIYPTILTDTTPTMKVNQEEVFGPLVTLIPYHTIE